MSLAITIIIRRASTAATKKPPRKFASVDEFAAAIAEAGDCEVAVVEGALSAAPPTGYLLAFPPVDFEVYAALAPRIVLMRANGENLNHDLDHYQVAGA